MSRVIFAKQSNTRREEFRVITRIEELQDGSRRVCKIADGEKAAEFVEGNYEKYTRLRDYFKDSELHFPTCRKEQGKVYIDYVDGDSFDTILAGYLEQDDIRGFMGAIRLLYQKITRGVETVPFHITEEFRNVFGNLEPAEGIEAYQVSDIDLIGSNLIAGEAWSAIDYEWTFFFPVPVEYILYRTITIFFFRHGNGKTITEATVMNRVNIDAEQQKLYRAMEESFQRYVYGNTSQREHQRELLVKKSTSLSELLDTANDHVRLEEENRALLAEREALIHEKEKLNAEQALLISERSKIAAEQEALLYEKEARIAEQETQKRQLEEKTVGLESALKTAEEKIAALQNENEEKAEEASSLVLRCAELQKLLAEQQSESDKRDREICSLQGENTALAQGCADASMHLEHIIGSPLYKLAHFFSRFYRQGLRGNQEERRNFRRWFMAHLRREKYDEGKYNPLCVPLNILRSLPAVAAKQGVPSVSAVPVAAVEKHFVNNEEGQT